MTNKSNATSTSPKAKGTYSAGATKRQREAEKMRQQQKAQQRLLLIVGVVAVLAVIGIIVVPNVIPVQAEVPTEATEKYSKYAAMGYTTKTADGFYALGREDAPVQMEEFSSFSCPHCRTFYNDNVVPVLDKIDAGQLRLIYVPLTQFGSYNSTPQTKAAMCAGEQGKFWEYHSTMFDWQGKYGSGANDGRRLAQGAANLGLDVGQFNTCFNGSEMDSVLARAEEVARERGVTGTPTVFLDGVKQSINLSTLRGYIEAKVAPVSVPATATAVP